MPTNRIEDSSEAMALGAYLRSRRVRMDAAALGYAGRRRTAGLRREEVAQRAIISATWYTWLEQGRGGKASADVLDRIAKALLLTDAEREHLFLLGVGHGPGSNYRGGAPLPASVQRLLDAMPASPALVRTATWDVVGWNRAALKVLTNYEALPPQQRNILRLLFCDPGVRARQPEWEDVARYVVASFRAEATRAGAAADIEPLVAELRAASPAFAALWDEKHVQTRGEEVKRITYPGVGEIALELTSLSVSGRPDLCIFVYNPVTEQDRSRVLQLLESEA